MTVLAFYASRGLSPMVPLVQVFAGTTPDGSAVIDSGYFVTPSARVNFTQKLSPLQDMTFYTVWLAAEDMQSPPLQQSTATRVIWQQPYLEPPQMIASIGNVSGSR